MSGATKDYAPVLLAYERLRRLVEATDPDEVRKAVEQHAVVTRDDPKLFELLVLFRLLDCLKGLGWQLGRLTLVRGRARFLATKNGDSFELRFQAHPG